jgi:NADH-quinone oxidoreductase subunit C
VTAPGAGDAPRPPALPLAPELPAETLVQALKDAVAGAVGPALAAAEGPDGAFVFSVPFARYRPAAETVRGLGFGRLEFLTCVDWRDRFTLTLQVYAFGTPVVARIKTDVPREGTPAPTVSDLWFQAEWEERECFDQFGLTFAGHPDLRRILNPEKWDGHPLRKDYADRLDIQRPQYW